MLLAALLLVTIAAWTALGAMCLNPADPYDDQPFGCTQCNGVFNSRHGFDLHACVRQPSAHVNEAC